MQSLKLAIITAACSTLLGACSHGPALDAQAVPAIWPAAASPAAITDAATEQRIDALLARMTLEQKVGQTIQADISTITPDDLRMYPLGSLLAGGNSGAYGNERATAADWDRMVREFRSVSIAPDGPGAGIPIIFGVDAVHGHNNIPGATIFPHNIGLGAARDAAMIRKIGAVTAAEISGSGIEWTFAPTLAVPQDPRWGRTYEGYSSDPSLVAAYSKAMVEGLQGPLVPGQPLQPGKVAATAKHFLADGGTMDGKDQGDAVISEAELVRVHAAGYPPAINAGALTVMASFSSWNGVKHHGNRSLLTDVLKERMGFEGFVVGDWNGHGQVENCSVTSCAASLNAGLDCIWRRQLEGPGCEHCSAGARRHDPDGPDRRRGAPHLAGQGEAGTAGRSNARRQQQSCRNRRTGSSGAGARSGRKIARAAKEQRFGPADPRRRQGAGRRARGQ